MALHTPLFDWHKAHGGRIVEFGGWMLPVQYTSIVAEHNAVRTGAGLFDISHMGRFSFAGPASQAVIDYAWTNDAAGMKDFQVRYGLVCNENGCAVDDILVYRWPYGWAMVVNASNRMAVLTRLKTYSSGKDVQITDSTEATAMLAVQGPNAVSMCAGMFEYDVSTIKYYFAMPTRWNGVNCVVSRTGYTGEDGLEVMIAGGEGPKLADEMLKRGATPCGLGARDSLRLEAAMPLYGHELNEDIDPYQAGLSWAVKPAKGDFVGKDEMLKRNENKSRRVRVGLVLDGSRSAREGCKLLANGKEVGVVTSGAPSPTLGKPIAMAYVDPAFAAVGADLSIDIRGAAVAAKVVAMPFYKREKK